MDSDSAASQAGLGFRVLRFGALGVKVQGFMVEALGF